MNARQIAAVEATIVTAGAATIVALVILRFLAPARWTQVRQSMVGNGAALGGLVAVLATAASLWFSEVNHFPPCRLCWFQRIAMYPLAVILPMAAIRRDRGIRPYATLLAGAGLAVNLWHLFIETFPSADPGGCDPVNPCTVRWVEAWGFWTIPRLVTVCFLVILTALWLEPHTPEELP